jgi:hypothetical protein
MLHVSRAEGTTAILDSVPSRILSFNFETTTLVPCVRDTVVLAGPDLRSWDPRGNRSVEAPRLCQFCFPFL